MPQKVYDRGDDHAHEENHHEAYGLEKGLRGRFGMYVPPALERLGLAEVEHNRRNNRMRSR